MFYIQDNKCYTITGTAALGKCRIPKKNLGSLKLTKEFWKANYCHPGTKIFFSSEAEAVRIKLKISRCVHINNMAVNGTSGIDIYERIGNTKLWRGCYAPRTPFTKYINLTLKQSAFKSQFEIIFPSYARVLDFRVNAVKGRIFKEIHPFSYKFICYGSSITQGSAASRPGLAYANILGEEFNAEIFNFGFSASAHGETEIADFISKIPMDIFIMEFDHNSGVQELKERHYGFYRQIRKNTSAPIIMISRISGGISNTLDEQKERNAIIRETYERALSEGDKNVFYICGDDLVMNQDREKFLSDDRHPNDYGMRLIAEAVAEKIKEGLGK